MGWGLHEPLGAIEPPHPPTFGRSNARDDVPRLRAGRANSGDSPLKGWALPLEQAPPGELRRGLWEEGNVAPAGGWVG